MFGSKAGAYSREKLLKAPVLLENIRLGWKGLPEKNALAYFCPMVS
jgi:hypothetical protein